MRLSKSVSKNSCTYYAIETYKDKDGVSHTRVYEKIGTHSKMLEEGIKDPLAYAKKRIKEINESRAHDVMDVNMKLDFTEKLEPVKRASSGTEKNVGWAYLREIFRRLGLHEFSGFKDTRAKYDAAGIFLHMVFSRVLKPESKKAALEHIGMFFGTKSYNLYDGYRFLGLLDKNSDALQKQLYEKTKEICDIDSSVLYYDCTNFYFETETQDDNEYDENGDILQYGFRRYGASKEHRPNPIVQMGLFTDRKGIPLSYCLHHGSNNEQNTVIPLEKRMLADYGTSEFIFCSDGGLGSYGNRLFNSVLGRNYIVTHSLKKTGKNDLDMIMTDMNWNFLCDGSKASLETFRGICDKRIAGENLEPWEEEMLKKDIIFKVFPAKHKVDASLFNPKAKGTVEMSETLHITFSAKYYIYQRTLFSRQLQTAEEWLGKKDADSIRKGPNDIRRFLKTVSVTDQGEIAENKTCEIDKKVVDEEKKFHGFYAIATSLDYGTKELLDINADRWRIEQSFRIMKSEFDSRPVFLSREEHIRAHFAICYTALLAYRILEEKVNADGEHFTTGEILSTMKSMNVVEKKGHDYYESIYTGSKVLERLEKVFDLKLDRKYYRSRYLDSLFE